MLDEHLATLTRVLEAQAAAAGAAPHIVRVRATGLTAPGIEVGLRPIDDLDASVVDALAGFTAPLDWLAIGVVSGGRAHHVGGHGGHRRPPTQVRVAHLVARSGACASAIRLAGDEVVVLTPDTAGPATGRVDDVCRRALGLPTPPPIPAVHFWALDWLDQLVDADPVPATWAEVAARHVAIASITETDPALAPDAVAQLGRLARRFAEINDWGALRHAYDVLGIRADDLPPAVARWLDDGAFSRWLLDGRPSIDETVAAACARLSPPLARRVRAVLTEWGIPTSRRVRQ